MFVSSYRVNYSTDGYTWHSYKNRGDNRSKVRETKFSSTLRQRNLKTEVRSENASNVFHSHDAGGISKRNNHQSFWICVWRKLGLRNHKIIMTASFYNICFQNVLRPHENENQCFQISPVWIAFSKSSVFVTVCVDGRLNRRDKAVFSWLISVGGRSNRRNKATFSNFSGVVGTLPNAGLS